MKSTCPFCLGTGHTLDHAALGHELRRTRMMLGVSLATIAARMGVDPSYLSYLEAGKRNWTLGLHERYLAAIRKS